MSTVKPAFSSFFVYALIPSPKRLGTSTILPFSIRLGGLLKLVLGTSARYFSMVGFQIFMPESPLPEPSRYVFVEGIR